jgi:ribosomal subunit interface protein
MVKEGIIMKTALRIRTNRLADALRGYIERRLQAGLARFSSRVAHVSVRISDVEGPSGQRLYSSRVEAEVRPSGGLLVREVSNGDLYAAIDLSFDRLGRALHRTLAGNELPTGTTPGRGARLPASPLRGGGFHAWPPGDAYRESIGKESGHDAS